MPKDNSTLWYRVCDGQYPFLWNTTSQPAARWHDSATAPTQYLADSPEGAWAEVLRHADIRETEDVGDVERSVWAIALPADLKLGTPNLSMAVMTGGLSSYPACQNEAARLRGESFDGLVAPSAALQPGGAFGYTSGTTLLMDEASRHDGQVIALFGHWPSLTGWRCVQRGSAHPSLLSRLRPLTR